MYQLEKIPSNHCEYCDEGQLGRKLESDFKVLCPYCGQMFIVSDIWTYAGLKYATHLFRAEHPITCMGCQSTLKQVGLLCVVQMS